MYDKDFNKEFLMSINYEVYQDCTTDIELTNESEMDDSQLNEVE